MPEIEDLQAALGRFVSSFAYAEAMLHIRLRHFTGMSDASARIVCAGMRNSDLVQRLKELSAISESSEKEKFRFERILKRFLIVSELRNQLIHKVSVFDSDGIISTGRLTSRVYEAEQTTFDIQTIEDAISDLRMMYVEIERMSFPEPEGFPDDLNFLDYSWQYTPVPPVIWGRKSQQAPL